MNDGLKDRLVVSLEKYQKGENVTPADHLHAISNELCQVTDVLNRLKDEFASVRPALWSVVSRFDHAIGDLTDIVEDCDNEEASLRREMRRRERNGDE